MRLYIYRVLCKDGHVAHTSTMPARPTDEYGERARRETAVRRALELDEWCPRPECKRGPHTVQHREWTEWKEGLPT